MTKFYYKDKNAPTPNGTREGSVTIIRCGAEYLFEKRADSDLWSLVGGGMKEGETPEQCAIREIKEETGMEIEPSALKPLERIDDPERIVDYDDGNVVSLITNLFYTELEVKPDITISHESDAMVWVTKGEAKSIALAATHVHIIDKYIKEQE